MTRPAYLILIAAFVGLFSGTLSSAFLYLLSLVTNIRETYPWLLWGLPVFGVIFGLIVQRLPSHIHQGVPYLIEELENDKVTVSPWMAPFIFLASLGTHLFGGSAGREGVGVVMGASIAHLLPFKTERSLLIYSGMAAGFSSIFGTPLAGILFAFELHHFKDIKRLDLLIPVILSAFIAHGVSHFLGPQHSVFLVPVHWSWSLLGVILLCGFLSGLAGQVFYWGVKGYTALMSHWISPLPLKLFVGGLLVALVVIFSGQYQYAGIGVELLQQSFTSPMTLLDFAMKALLTVMTISIGFKGGEVTPLFIMGATLSNSVSVYLGLKTMALSSAIGMVSLFGAVSATPLASAVMGAELFGLETFPLCLVGCYLARAMMGKRSVYRH